MALKRPSWPTSWRASLEAGPGTGLPAPEGTRRGAGMLKSPSTKVLAAAVVVAFAAVVSIAGASTTARPGVHNGVVTACVEPPTKGNRATSGDLNLVVCLKGARQISWSIRGPRGGAGPAGSAGPAGAQ